MASVSRASMEGTFNYLLQPNYLSSKSIKFNGRKTTFGWRSSFLCSKHSVGGLAYESRRSVCFKYNCSSSPGIKWKRSAMWKVSSSLQSALNASVSIVYDASSELKSRLSSVLQGHTSAKRAMKETNAPLEPTYSKLNKGIPVNFMVGLGIIVAFIVIALRGLMARQLRDDGHGSVSDLVKRGQLRSDRRVIPSPLKYDDPFNNPLVRVGKRNSTVKMYGKVFRLTPVTLTREKALSHQNRRVRAYQWKRPTVFLKEGEPIPPGVDPDTVRWIPANHPFATATNDIDEDFAQKNIYQKRGVPSRVRAEHEALQRKMGIEATQNEHMSTPTAENPHGSENQSKHPDSLEKASNQPNGDSYNDDLRKINRKGDSSGCQTFEEDVFQDSGLRPVNHTTQFLESSERHRLSKMSVQQTYFEELPNN